MQLVIISGRSGSGKSTALHQLEDEGYYCIDNLPAALLPALVAETQRGEFEHFRGVAVCIDARNAWRNLQDFSGILDALPADVRSEILYLDAQDPVLIKRFSETRRKHPLSGDQLPLAEAIDSERQLLEPIASAAALVLDTSQMTIYELRDAIRQRVVGDGTGSMSILFQSFGFKRGLPNDADLVFDVRMLPNPHWVKELRLLTGLDADVASFLEAQSMTGELFDSIRRFLDQWLPHYRESNRSYMTVAVGCTGGQHRSVYLADRLYQYYRQQYSHVHLRHRELQ
ncbi:RapZ family nucleotide-binding protein [Haliea atlantica]|nr:RNase adapter RapZ [Haliea sp.]MAL95915.1 RNase adapter RapZ [Haliea sp.]